jgi:hypothetical protein
MQENEQRHPVTSLDEIVAAICSTPHLTDEDKLTLVRLIEHSRRILRGEADPDAAS